MSDTRPMTADEFAKLRPIDRGFAVYMCGALPDQPHIPDEENPYQRGTRAYRRWRLGQQRAVQAELDSP